MKVATIQCDCKLGDIRHNIRHADSLLKAADLQGVEMLVGPELALTGYNFSSLEAISAFLEPSCGGATAWWAINTARRYGLVISIGYPEITLDPGKIPDSVPFIQDISCDEAIATAQEEVSRIRALNDEQFWTFNSTLTVGPNGKVLAHYRKTHLYYTDVTWASPSIEGFTTHSILFPEHNKHIDTSFAICMDLNPRAFSASWTDYEVASHAISTKATLLIVSTAWMTRENATVKNDDSPCCAKEMAKTPHLENLKCWLERLVPLIKSEKKTTVVIANRIGTEEGEVRSCELENLKQPLFKNQVNLIPQEPSNYDIEMENKHPSASEAEIVIEDTDAGLVCISAHYVGTSTVMVLGDGAVFVYGLSPRGTEEVLVADTNNEAIMTFRLKQTDE